jgi:hypothetical protein
MSAASTLRSSGLIFGGLTDNNFVFFFWQCICFGLEPMLDPKSILQEFFYEIFG